MIVLFLVNQLLKVCGVSKHLYELLSELREYDDIKIVIATGGGNVINKFEKLGYEIIVNENFNHDNRSYYGFIKGVYWLSKFLNERKISIVHSHHHYAANIAQTTKLFRKSTTILTNHGILPEIGMLSHFPSDHIIAVNQHVFDHIRNNKKYKSKSTHLIHQGIRNRFTGSKKRNTILRFISASRIVKEKGLDTFIKAISYLSENEKSEAEFLLAGEGKFLDELLDLESRIRSGIKYIGVLDDVQDYLKTTDVFVMTSTAVEGFPTSLIEAAYAKNLIITSNFSGIENFFEDNKDGLIYEINNANELSEKLRFTIQNFHKLGELVENFYRKSVVLFDLRLNAKKTYDLYKSILR
ncbi:MAG: glycosyltransferase family 4 protein [Ignavibacteria bacterium]|jgi:glycosyltransferase involved in cell wall biosynthesis